MSEEHEPFVNWIICITYNKSFQGTVQFGCSDQVPPNERYYNQTLELCATYSGRWSVAQPNAFQQLIRSVIEEIISEEWALKMKSNMGQNTVNSLWLKLATSLGLGGYDPCFRYEYWTARTAEPRSVKIERPENWDEFGLILKWLRQPPCWSSEILSVFVLLTVWKSPQSFFFPSPIDRARQA